MNGPMLVFSSFLNQSQKGRLEFKEPRHLSLKPRLWGFRPQRRALVPGAAAAIGARRANELLP